MDRKFVMTQLEPHTYALPSNDGKTLWRIRRYAEDGSLQTWSERRKRYVTVKGHFWSLEKFVGRMFGGDVVVDDLFDGENWVGYAYGFKTRREAVESALRDA